MKRNTTQPETPTGNKFGVIPTSAPAPFGDKGDVAALLKGCRRSVDGYMAQGLPHLKLGARKVRFDLEEVRAWAKRDFGTRRIGKEKRVVNPICFCTGDICLATLRTVRALASVLWFLFRYFAVLLARLLADIDNETDCDL